MRVARQGTHCACGNRLAADNDEELVQQVLTHTHEVHPEMDMGKEQARELMVSEVSDGEEVKD